MKQKIIKFYADKGLHIPKLIARRRDNVTPEQIEQAAETYYYKLQGGYKPAKNLLIASEVGELARGIDAKRYVKDKELLERTKEVQRENRILKFEMVALCILVYIVSAWRIWEAIWHF